MLREKFRKLRKTLLNFHRGTCQRKNLSANTRFWSGSYCGLVVKLLSSARFNYVCRVLRLAEMQDGFMESVRLAKLNGSYNGQEYKVWAAFKSVMGRVGRSLPQLVLQTGRMTHSMCHRFTQYKSIILRVLRMLLQFFKLQ